MAGTKVHGHHGQRKARRRSRVRERGIGPYYISSKKLSAEELHNASKSHGLVASMHWQLDVGFREDKCRIRVDDHAEELSRIRQACFNLLKQETSAKGGIQRK
jgi:predicted transposase YbfD/YdcC